MNDQPDTVSISDAEDTFEYTTGFGNEFATEAQPGALPEGRNSPQKPPLGLYAEVISGTAFTVPRDRNQRTWMYRIRPSAIQPPFEPMDTGLWQTPPFAEVPATPDRLRWDPLPIPEAPTDIIQGMTTMAGNGSIAGHGGVGIHIYTANQAPPDRYFFNADAEMLFVPQQGRLVMHSELGHVAARPREICVIPRGVKFRVDLPDGPSRGYVCENFGAPLRLPDLGPLGSSGLANPRDFLTPVAAYEESDADCELVCKFNGRLWRTTLPHSPLDVVAWHGNYAPYKYDLARFNTMGTVSYDHPDPSIYTVLTSPSGAPLPGTANVDFVIFPPRWLVGEDTFRPPWYHRNFMNEFMGLIQGLYDAKATGFVPGGSSLHNCMAPHGPDADTWRKATEHDLSPQKLVDTMAFMFETNVLCQPTRFAMETPCRQADYHACWDGLEKHFPGGP